MPAVGAAPEYATVRQQRRSNTDAIGFPVKYAGRAEPAGLLPSALLVFILTGYICVTVNRVHRLPVKAKAV